MPDFSKSAAKLLAACVQRFREGFERDVVEILEQQFRGVRPAEVKDALEELALLERQLTVRANPVVVHDTHSRLLKRVIIEERRHAAEAIDVPIQKAVDASLIRELRATVRPYEQLMTEAWFRETAPARVPRLTDYLSVRYGEETLAQRLRQLPREYDEKFHILEAPALFLPDLAYYRARCGLRELGIAVAYMDIDDFKDFNTRYTETKVDLDLLTPFMEAIEAHVFAHGHAYRFGGDEYVVLVPNSNQGWAIEMLSRLQARLSRARYKGITGAPTVSIGLCMVEPDCAYTDREVLEHANAAKAHAKREAKGSIAYAGDGETFTLVCGERNPAG
jgi:diguanylate cyclase (GGDEF)-like protein